VVGFIELRVDWGVGRICFDMDTFLGVGGGVEVSVQWGGGGGAGGRESKLR